MLRSLLGHTEVKVTVKSPEARELERRRHEDDLLRRQHNLARRVHILEWQTPPPHPHDSETTK